MWCFNVVYFFRDALVRWPNIGRYSPWWPSPNQIAVNYADVPFCVTSFWPGTFMSYWLVNFLPHSIRTGKRSSYLSSKFAHAQMCALSKTSVMKGWTNGSVVVLLRVSLCLCPKVGITENKIKNIGTAVSYQPDCYLNHHNCCISNTLFCSTVV